MTSYAWPGWGARHFEMRVMPNLRTYVGAYTPTMDVLDLLGESWMARIDLVPEENKIAAAAREAFFDRLKGPANTIDLYHLKNPVPNGTMRGTVTLKNSVLQLANTATLAGCTSGVNLLLSGGFEIDTNADGIADGWESYTNGTFTGAAYSLVAGQSSPQAQRMFAATLGSGGSDLVGVRRVTPYPVTAGQTFSLSADFTANATTFKIELYVDWLNGGGGVVSTSRQSWTAPVGWVRKELNGITAPAGAVNAKIYAWIIQATSGSNLQAYVDNVQWEQSATASPYAGLATARAGDMLSLSGQLVRVLADAAANDAGDLAIEFTPRARAAWSSAAAVVWNRPTTRFRLKSDGVPTVWSPGFAEGASFELIEDV